jgi:hypothetical protein
LSRLEISSATATATDDLNKPSANDKPHFRFNVNAGSDISTRQHAFSLKMELHDEEGVGINGIG